MPKITKNLIAPCGMNCGLCLMHLRQTNKCPGCYTGRKVNQRPIKCGIKLCKERRGEFCFECEKFPCDRLKRLDKRYREKYQMSEIENLKMIRDEGIGKFLKEQKQKYLTSDGILCVHDKKRYPND
jgi:hypothetical protein